MKTGHLINLVIAVCLIFIAGNQFLVAGSLTPPAATVAPTMASLQQIFDQQRFAAFAGGNMKAGPGLITSADPVGTGRFLEALAGKCLGTGTGNILCDLTIQNLGDCDVRIDATAPQNVLDSTNPAVEFRSHSVTVPAEQSYAGSRLLRVISNTIPDSIGPDGFGTYTFLGGTDCQFMWVIR